MNRELLLDFRRKKKSYNLRKRGQASQEEYRALVYICREKA